MLYSLLRIYVRLAMKIFCPKIILSHPEQLRSGGPLLLAANHPNSFLDAIIIDALFARPVWSLARGDVFRNKFIGKILYRLKILPVYRVSEGVENLQDNYSTFDQCLELFRKNGIVLIFSEGRCINEWKLRPLKKGTARLAISCWEKQIPLRVLPVGINYSSFKRFGKIMRISFGEQIETGVLNGSDTEGQRLLRFNQALQSQLEGLVLTIDPNDVDTLEEQFHFPLPAWKKILLAIPALAGWILHAPLYYAVRGITRSVARHSDHYDSILVGLLLVSYPAYIFLLILLGWLAIPGIWVWGMLLVLPFTAWATANVRREA